MHRDVKPQNILVTERGHPYLADFGVAKGSNTYDLTATGGFVGSVNYASPEQIGGSTLTAASDIYALTAVLYTCLTGEVPFPHESDPAIMYAHLHKPPPVLPGGCDADSDLCAAIARGMAKEPDARYPHARDLLEAASHAVIAMPPARRHAIPAFPSGRASDLGKPRSPEADAGARLAAPTAADQRRTPPLASTPPAAASSRRRPLTAAAIGVLLAAVAAVAFFALSGRTPRATALRRENLDLSASLAPAALPRVSLAKTRSHTAHYLSRAETSLAAGDEQATDSLAILQTDSRSRRTSIAALTAALRQETATLRMLAAAASHRDREAYTHLLAAFPALQTDLARALRTATTVGFSAPVLPAIPASALTLAAPRRPPHRFAKPKPALTGSVVSQTVSSTVSSAPATPTVSPPTKEYVAPSTASHSPPARKGSSQRYAPTVVSPPVG